MKRKPLILAAAVLIAIFSSLLFVFQVRKSEVAVVTTFASVTREITNSGPNLKLPWPIQKVFKLDQRVQIFESGFEEVKLPDQYAILMQVYVGWTIEKPAVFFPKFANGSVSDAKEALENLVRTAKNEVAVQHPFQDFISADEKFMKFAQIEKEILAKVQEAVRQRDYGIDVKFIQIKKLGLPQTVTENVFGRMQSEREVKISTIKYEGEEAATKIKSQADSDAAKLLANAEAQARQIRGEGEAEAMKSLDILRQNPELAIFNMRLEALEQMLKERATLFLSLENPNKTMSMLEKMLKERTTSFLDQGTPPQEDSKRALNVEAGKK